MSAQLFLFLITIQTDMHTHILFLPFSTHIKFNSLTNMMKIILFIIT